MSGRDNFMMKLAIQSILKNPTGFDWSLQGFGMLRLYLSPTVRLHVWSTSAKVPGVSEVHDHPWSFSSVIIAGQLVNTRLVKNKRGIATHMEQTLLCGPGGGLKGRPTPVNLTTQVPELYLEGHTYVQDASEIHRSEPADGTVTLIERRFGTDVDHAHVYWPVATGWVTAEPRRATRKEVRDITKNALDKWFKG